MAFRVAINPSTPPDALEHLASISAERSVLSSVAAHPSAPGALLATLAGNEDWAVRQAVASSSALPRAAAATLAGDDNPGVRSALAKNSATPGDVLARLANDRADSVARNALDRITQCIIERFGVSRHNTEALEMWRSMPWWDIAPDSDTARLVATLYPPP